MVATDSNDDSAPLHLGFCEPIHDEEDVQHIAHRSPLWSNWDGGQVGGRPSWLNPRHLPPTLLSCGECNPTIPLRFVCQLYAPADTVNPNAFHRTLYVFACPTCSSVRVLRTQLAQDNDYYPRECNENDCVEWNNHLPETHGIKVCKVCGQRGIGVCPLQHESFCGKHHQKEHKQHVFNKQENVHDLPSVFPMYELVVEEEEPIDDSVDNVDEKHDALFEHNKDGDDSDEDLEQDDLNDMTGARGDMTQRDDPVTDAFFHRMERAKNQCIRYHQWHKESPLWQSSNHIPSSIPDCPYCGAPRQFEFQLMPQLLHYLKQCNDKNDVIPKEQKEVLLAASMIVEKTDPKEIPVEFKERHDKALQNVQSKLLGNQKELDWGVVVVYTCTASCGSSNNENGDEQLGAYREEYAWVQPPLR